MTTMTNEQLAARIREGKTWLLPILWEQIEKLASKLTGEYVRHNPMSCTQSGMTADDLMGECYLAMVDAVDSYDPEQGDFVPWYCVHVRKAFNAATGNRTQRERLDPLRRADRLERQLDTEEEEGATLGDTIADPVDPYESADERIYRQQLRGDIEKSLEQIPEKNAEVIRSRYFGGKTLAQIGEAGGVSIETIRQRERQALRELRGPKGKRLRAYREEILSGAYRGSGLSRYRDTGTSSTEYTAMKLIELELEKWRTELEAMKSHEETLDTDEPGLQKPF